MDVLNKKERISAFLLFLLMLTITLGVLITAIFFNYKIPWKENEVIKLENEKIINEFNFQKAFSNKIDKISKLVDSLDNAEEGFIFLEQTINYELVDLKESIPQESFDDGRLYENIILNINELVKTKKNLLQLNDSENKLKEQKEQLDLYAAEVEKLERDLDLCNRLNRGR